MELDCWDGDGGEPVITHGHTLCTKIRFEDVCQAVAETAFATCAYPVSLSLEVHCSPKQQARMGELLRRYFGDALLLPGQIGEDASPESLKGKVLVKGKVPAPVRECDRRSPGAQGSPGDPLGSAKCLPVHMPFVPSAVLHAMGGPPASAQMESGMEGRASEFDEEDEELRDDERGEREHVRMVRLAQLQQHASDVASDVRANAPAAIVNFIGRDGRRGRKSLDHVSKALGMGCKSGSGGAAAADEEDLNEMSTASDSGLARKSKRGKLHFRVSTPGRGKSLGRKPRKTIDPGEHSLRARECLACS